MIPDGALDASGNEPNDGNATPARIGRVTIPDPSDTLGDQVVEQTMQRLIETAG